MGHLAPPPAMEDTEVSSQRPSPGRGGADETVQKAPEDNTSDAVERGTATPMTTEGGGPQQFGPSPNTVPETSTAPGSDQHPPSKEGGGAAAPSAASVNPEAADTLQEALQSGGDRDWRGVLTAIEQAVTTLPVPVIIKEVGAGLSVAVAERLAAVGVTMLDVAGAGGTSWAAVEGERADSARRRAVAMAFTGWGIPTADALCAIRARLPEMPLIASGGIANGIDAAKAIRLGANLVGQAAAVLGSATTSTDAVTEHFQVVIDQLRVACFCTGSENLAALKQASLVPVG